MPQRVVLVTGASRELGSRVAGALAADPSVARVIGVDTVVPPPALAPLLGSTELVRADIRNPLIAKVIAQADVDTVVHTGVLATPRLAGGRAAMKEINVIGTMQLLAACQKAPSMRKLVVKSTGAVYGSSSRSPALFTEDLEPRLSGSGFAKDSVEVEGYVRGFARRRPDVALTVLRFANVLGEGSDSPLGRYLRLPVVPSMLGFDPRLQLCHEDDAVAVLREAALEDRPGTFNVAGEGVLLLSQAVRRLGRPEVPVPSLAVGLLARAARGIGLLDFSPEQLHVLEHGRVLDVSRLARAFRAVPRATAEVFDDFAARHASAVIGDVAATTERVALDLLHTVRPSTPGAVRA